MFAVRQFPGNGADLDFREVLSGCTAAIVAAAPIEGTLSTDTRVNHLNANIAKEAFLKGAEYAAAAKVLPFCRLWCAPPPHARVRAQTHRAPSSLNLPS